MKQIFKVGDRVYHHIYGWGTIVDIHGVNQRILTEFDEIKNLIREMYSEKPMLSFTEYKLVGFSQERPEELPKKGDIVWVRGGFTSEWQIGHFFEKKYKEYRVTVNTSISGWTHYGIEITTINPYKDEN